MYRKKTICVLISIDQIFKINFQIKLFSEEDRKKDKDLIKSQFIQLQILKM